MKNCDTALSVSINLFKTKKKPKNYRFLIMYTYK